MSRATRSVTHFSLTKAKAPTVLHPCGRERHRRTQLSDTEQAPAASAAQYRTELYHQVLLFLVRRPALAPLTVHTSVLLAQDQPVVKAPVPSPGREPLCVASSTFTWNAQSSMRGQGVMVSGRIRTPDDDHHRQRSPSLYQKHSRTWPRRELTLRTQATVHMHPWHTQAAVAPALPLHPRVRRAGSH